MSNTHQTLSPQATIDATEAITVALIEDFDATKLSVAVQRLTAMTTQCSVLRANGADVMPAITCIELAVDNIEEMAELVGTASAQRDVELEAFMGTALFAGSESAADSELLTVSLLHRLAALRQELAPLL